MEFNAKRVLLDHNLLPMISRRIVTEKHFAWDDLKEFIRKYDRKDSELNREHLTIIKKFTNIRSFHSGKTLSPSGIPKIHKEVISEVLPYTNAVTGVVEMLASLAYETLSTANFSMTPILSRLAQIIFKFGPEIACEYLWLIAEKGSFRWNAGYLRSSGFSFHVYLDPPAAICFDFDSSKRYLLSSAHKIMVWDPNSEECQFYSSNSSLQTHITAFISKPFRCSAFEAAAKKKYQNYFQKR
jgi:hypothetical protein